MNHKLSHVKQTNIAGDNTYKIINKITKEFYIVDEKNISINNKVAPKKTTTYEPTYDFDKATTFTYEEGLNLLKCYKNFSNVKFANTYLPNSKGEKPKLDSYRLKNIMLVNVNLEEKAIHSFDYSFLEF